jgi:hypothetical protein
MTVVLFFIGIYTGVINKSVVDMLWLNWSHILVVSEILAFGLSLIFYLKGWIWKQVLFGSFVSLLSFIHLFSFYMKLLSKKCIDYRFFDLFERDIPNIISFWIFSMAMKSILVSWVLFGVMLNG